MAVLGVNNCSPARIYGPAYQYIFCGCSVKSFSVSAGWNEQSSELTVELVQDSCAGRRIWWDENLNRQDDSNTADPGFTYPEPGCAVYFRIEENPDGATEADRGGFEYCGLIRGWTEKRDANNNPAFTVKISDPRIVLENTQVIVNDYPGNTEGVWNLINVYGFVESLGTSCTTSEAGGFGGVTNDNVFTNIANDRGMNWNDVRCGIQTLCSAVDKNVVNNLYFDFCVDNRLTYVGPVDGTAGYGVLKKDDTITNPAFLNIPNANLNQQYYYIDLTEIPFAPNYYRVSGPNISLTEIISQVCQDAGCDYYIELLPVKKGNNIEKVIKVRIAVRSSQPQLGRLDDFISARQTIAANANGGIISHTKGEEVRNEETSIYLMGGKKREAFVAPAAQILPYWGLDTDGNLLQASIVGNEYRINLDTDRINATLNTSFPSRYQTITERELRAALSDIESWKEVTHLINGNFATYLDSIGQTTVLDLSKMRAAVDGDKLAASPIVVPNGDIIDQNGAKDLEIVYNFVRSYADEFYGKKFIVNASSFVCAAIDGSSQKYRYSHEPSTEGCWVEDGTTTILGLIHNSAASDFFRDEVGKYQPILRFPLVGGFTLGGAGGGLTADPSKLDEDFITDGVDEIWVKADVDSRWLFGTNLNPFANTVSFVLSISAPVVNTVSDTNGLIEPFCGTDILLNGQALLNSPIDIIDKTLVYGALTAAIAPNGALCPTVNNVDVYGPWGVAGLPGQVSLASDEGLVPWEYGSDVVMNNAALDQVNGAVAQMRKGERGSVTVAGVPNIPIGAELFSVDSNNPPASQQSQKYFGTRSYSTSVCAANLPFLYIQMNKWEGEFGPNVTQVNVQYGDNGFTTEYQFSTYTPEFGRFNKDNSERLKNIGKQRLQLNRNIRAKEREKGILAQKKNRQFIENQIGRSARAPKSPHHVFVGRYRDSKGRVETNTQSIRELNSSFQSNTTYASTAIMSFDGLLRPVSKAGDGGFSAFAAFSSEYCDSLPDRPKQATPPVNEYTRLSVTQLYLDPLANPNTSLPTDRSDTASVGHDIEVLGRNPTRPNGSFYLPEASDYASDYRFLALRGPIIIQQWGYDLDGKPIPNKNDVDANAENGNFLAMGLADKFLDNWLQKPSTWPVAPLDLRLDRERGVWTIPQPPRIIHASGDVCLATPQILTPTNITGIYDADGNEVTNPTITGEWPWTINPPDNIGKVPVYYDNVDCKYYVFPVNRLDVNVTGDDYIDIKKIVFDEGFRLDSFNESDCNDTITISATGGGGSGGCFYSDTASWTGCFGVDYADCFSLSNSWPVADSLVTGSTSFNCVKLGAGLTVSTGEDTSLAEINSWNFLSSVDFCASPPQTGDCQRYTHLILGTGLTYEERVADCSYYIHSDIKASGSTKETMCDTGTNPSGYTFQTLEFVGPLSVTKQDSCVVQVSGIRPLIGKPSNSCAETPPLAGESFISTKPFGTLYIDEGLRLVQGDGSADCEFTLYGGLKFGVNNCTQTVDDDYYYGITIGKGLSFVDGDACEGVIHQPLTFIAPGIAGQQYTADRSCIGGPPITTNISCLVCGSGGAGIGLELVGPFCNRIPPRYWDTIGAGPGIGIVGCDDDCTTVFFNNHRDWGLDTEAADCSEYVTHGQVAFHEYSDDFSIGSSIFPGEAGGGCNGLHETLGTQISLNGFLGPWSMRVITNITCYKDGGGNITGIDCECTELAGNISCGGKYWIESTGSCSSPCPTC